MDEIHKNPNKLHKHPRCSHSHEEEHEIYECPLCGTQYDNRTVEFIRHPKWSWLSTTINIVLFATGVLLLPRVIAISRLWAFCSALVTLYFLREIVFTERRRHWRIAFAPDGYHQRFRRGKEIVIPWLDIEDVRFRDEDGCVVIIDQEKGIHSFSGITVFGSRANALKFVDFVKQRIAIEVLRATAQKHMDRIDGRCDSPVD